MKFEYTGRHVEVTPTIRSHVEDHFSKIEALFNDDSARTHVRIEVEKNRHIGEIIVHWQQHTLTATDVNDDMYQALTRAIDKIEKQALKLKKKIIAKSHSGSRTQILETTAAADGSAAIDKFNDNRTSNRNGNRKSKSANAKKNSANAKGDSDGNTARIISARRYPVKPMTAEEAAMQLSADTEQFVVFRDADTERVGVLYKRKDGNFGLIEP